MSEQLPLETWEVFARARGLLGMPLMQGIFGNRSATHLYRWGRNPEATADTKRNPLDWLQRLFAELHAQGGEEVAVGALQLLAEGVPGWAVVKVAPDAPEGLGAKESVLRAQKAQARWISLVGEDLHPNFVDLLTEETVASLREAAACYRRDKDAGADVRFAADRRDICITSVGEDDGFDAEAWLEAYYAKQRRKRLPVWRRFWLWVTRR